MRPLSTLLGILLLILIMGCEKKQDPKSMLKNEDTRDEIFTEIANDPALMNGFMQEMHTNDKAMSSMRQNMWMDSKMMSDEDMRMMKRNGERMQHLMQRMLDDSTMTRNMMTHMKKRGIISTECYESCVQNLNKTNQPAKKD